MNFKTKHSEKKQTRIPLGLLTVISAAIACSLIGIEFFRRFSFNNNAPIENWITTATYLNNAISPILLFASVLLLYRTWSDSKKALEVQKQELEATKVVLKEQTDTQNFSVFKEALFEITDSIDILLEKKVLFKRTEGDSRLYTEGSWGFKTELKEFPDDERFMTYLDFLSDYFFEKRRIRVKNDEVSESFKKLIFTDTYQYIEKIKTIALLFHKQELNVHRDTLELIIFHRLHIFVWLMFLEIAYKLYREETKENSHESAELVFEVIAGLTCRQLKEIYWLKALSPEIERELRARNLL